jgi:hypothetical protein
MNRVLERDTAAPAESHDAVLRLGRGQRHSVTSNGIQLSLDPRWIEGSDCRDSQWRNDAIGAVRKIFHRQKIWRNRNETVGSELVCNAADPRRQPKDLMND